MGEHLLPVRAIPNPGKTVGPSWDHPVCVDTSGSSADWTAIEGTLYRNCKTHPTKISDGFKKNKRGSQMTLKLQDLKMSTFLFGVLYLPSSQHPFYRASSAMCFLPLFPNVFSPPFRGGKILSEFTQAWQMHKIALISSTLCFLIHRS